MRGAVERVPRPEWLGGRGTAVLGVQQEVPPAVHQGERARRRTRRRDRRGRAAAGRAEGDLRMWWTTSTADSLLALDGAQGAQHRRDLQCGVLVDLGRAREGVEHQAMSRSLGMRVSGNEEHDTLDALGPRQGANAHARRVESEALYDLDQPERTGSSFRPTRV